VRRFPASAPATATPAIVQLVPGWSSMNSRSRSAEGQRTPIDGRVEDGGLSDVGSSSDRLAVERQGDTGSEEQPDAPMPAIESRKLPDANTYARSAKLPLSGSHP